MIQYNIIHEFNFLLNLFLKLICFLGTLGAASGWRWSSFEGAFVRASLLPLTTFILQLGIEVVTWLFPYFCSPDSLSVICMYLMRLVAVIAFTSIFLSFFPLNSILHELDLIPPCRKGLIRLNFSRNHELSKS